MIVVLDADILSSLAKIKRLSLIKSLFPEYEIVVPSKIQDAILDGLINSSSHVRQIKADLKRHDYFEFKKEINQYLEELPTRIELKYS